MKMKKLTAGLCALAVLGSMIAIPTVNAEMSGDYTIFSGKKTHTSGNYEYSIFEDGTVEIEGYIDDISGDFVIPSKIDNIVVTRLGFGAFGYSSITSVTMPDTITFTDEGVFSNCANLTEVNLSNNLISIGYGAFKECNKLESISIPESVTDIGNYAFTDCLSLSDIYFSGTLSEWNMMMGDYDQHVYSPYTTIHCTNGIIEATEPMPEKPVDSSSDTDSSSENDSSSQTDNDSRSDNESRTDPAPAKKSLSKAKVKAASKTYTGKALTPDVTVTLDGKTLKNGTDYTVSYKNNKKCGKAKVTVTGKGNYTGSKSGSFIIKPAKVAAKKLTSPKKNTIKLTWTKAKGGVTGYQVMTATNKKFNKGKKTYNVKATAASKTVKSLKSKKTYYAKVRAFKKIDGKNYLGSWSKIKKVKCK